MAELQVPTNARAPTCGDFIDDAGVEGDNSLAGLAGVGEIAEIELLTSAADVDDSFYQFATPQLASWFAIRQLVDPAEYGVTKTWDSTAGRLRDVRDGERVYLGFSCLPMGWSWALHFCHSAVSHLARLRQNIPVEATVRERSPGVQISPGQPALGIYVDNVYSIGCAVGDSLRMVTDFVDVGNERQLRTHWECKDATEATVLGVEVWGRQRLLRPGRRRVWRLFRAAQALLGRATVNVLEMEIWVGHFIHICQLCRPLMSVLEEIYQWMASVGRGRAPLTPGVREELWMASNLAFLSEANLSLPWSDTVWVSDSSDHGYAVMWTRGSQKEIIADGQHREKWRFARLEVPASVSHLAGSVVSSLGGASLHAGPVVSPEGFADANVKPLGSAGIGQQTRYGAALLLTDAEPEAKPRLGRSAARPQRATAQVEVLRAIPEVGRCWERSDRWHTAREGGWWWPSEHINIKEARASLMALERHTSSAQRHHCKLLQLSDNLVSVFAFDKGRSKSWALNAMCRRACALTVAADIVWRLRHIRSEGNVSDEGSRRECWRSPLAAIGHRLVRHVQPLVRPVIEPPPIAEVRPSRRFDEVPFVPCVAQHVVPAPPVAAVQWQVDQVSPPPPEALVDDVPAPPLAPETGGGSTAVAGRPRVAGPPRTCSVPEKPVRTSLVGSRSLPSPLAKARPSARVVRGPNSAPRRALDRDAQIALELFAGQGHLTRALRREGIETVAFEITDDARYDLTRRSTQQTVLSWVRAGRIAYTHIGIPCTVWSIARRGITNWSKARQKEEISIALVLFMVRLFRECVRCGVPVSVENPLSSKLWEFHLVRELMSLSNCRFVVWDMCRFGSAYRKPTALLTTLSELESLSKRCNHAFRHIPAAGSTRVRVGSGYKWVARTTLAGVYPAQLCTAWARQVRSASSLAASSRPRDAAKLAARLQAELDSHVRRRSSAKGHRAPAATAIEQQLGGDDYATGAGSALREAQRHLATHTVTFGGSAGTRIAGEGTQSAGRSRPGAASSGRSSN